ncbi:AbrB/MazE/SpoVT family DNA-binding domain-containing protein|uniref:Transcriptional pleiotropic regulator of transition state genes n=1 Tax=Dendrosporobacter quercicolus TaxID=146817 RepID=A0A1G9ZV48_9FIRM|nr:AbrB/MazE/SpoVT family DNA-binding domain-containing protein [Dendrosporobacter quercicolus]NSL49616.1 AbrB/MazE/SpoVT family DNA-binding domain-containing protein [Dendrosporobacter quercicolus DSM 1736]SDN25118.1 transcriptional pleiotropic regulator of transition state genes [Dendrosporobacter quercicolus]
MKSTGIVRRVDDLGRVVIPKELRRNLDIKEGDPMEIYVENDRIILRKYEPACECIFCGNDYNVLSFKGKVVCGNCRAELLG